MTTPSCVAVPSARRRPTSESEAGPRGSKSAWKSIAETKPDKATHEHEERHDQHRRGRDRANVRQSAGLERAPPHAPNVFHAHEVRARDDSQREERAGWMTRSQRATNASGQEGRAEKNS